MTDNKTELSEKQRRRQHMQSLTKEERSYIRRRELGDKLWVVCRAVILCGLGFIIFYPLIYMISCTFRGRADMNDPTVVWIPRRPTLSVLRETIEAMDFWNTLLNTVLLNVGCSLVQVLSCDRLRLCAVQLQGQEAALRHSHTDDTRADADNLGAAVFPVQVFPRYGR